MYRWIALIFLTCSISLWGIEPKKPLEHVVLQLHWKYQFEFAGFIAAKEKGFYKDVGLDVELREYQNGMDVEEEVLSGRANYGVYNSQLLLDYFKGKPFRLIGSFFKRSALVLVTQPSIKSVDDLSGKTVMAGTKRDFYINFQPFLKKHNVDIESLHFVPHTYTIEPFIEKKVDAFTAFRSDQIPKLRKRNIPFNVLDPSEDNLFVMQMELFTTNKELQNHKERTQKFVLASIKGWEYALDHIDEMVDIIYKKYNRGISKEDLLTEAKEVMRLVLPYTYEIGSIEKSFLIRQGEFFKKDYNIDTQREIDEYIYDVFEEGQLRFSTEELAYIKKHPTVTVCPHFSIFPIDGMKNGKQIGIMGDVFSLISKKTGLEFKPIESKNFQEILQHVIQKDCEILSVATPQIVKEFNLYSTDVLMKSHFTILTTIDKAFLQDSNEILGKKFLIKDPYLLEYIKKIYPTINIKYIENEQRMVQTLLDGKAYGILMLDEQSDYFIDQYGYGKLKLGGFLAKEQPIESVIAITKEQPLLASIIAKTIKNIKKEELRKIIDSWHMTRYHKQTDYRVVIGVMLVMSIILLIMIYYHKKIQKLNNELERKVIEKTKELRELNAKLEALVQEKVEEIIQKDRLLSIQSKQAIMGEMITMIAHQWRQPLNTLTLQISNLQLRRMMGEVVEIDEYDQTLTQISQTITYLSETIDDFQTFFHPDRELVEVRLYEVIEKALGFVRGRIKSTEIEIISEVQEDLHVKIYLNELIQVLLNILNNAIDALLECDRDKKRVIIRSYVDTEIKIEIKDNACGIDPAIMGQLFEPYFSTKGKNGTGLGLYMSQMIMQKQFGGDVVVESSTEGSSFTIIFPKF